MHLLVTWANLIFSFANCSSKSYNSKLGTWKSLIIGSKTANCKGGNGVSNWGGIIDKISCLTFNLSYNSIASWTKLLSILN